MKNGAPMAAVFPEPLMTAPMPISMKSPAMSMKPQPMNPMTARKRTQPFVRRRISMAMEETCPVVKFVGFAAGVP